VGHHRPEYNAGAGIFVEKMPALSESLIPNALSGRPNVFEPPEERTSRVCYRDQIASPEEGSCALAIVGDARVTLSLW
jgi:hypothetical protein